jgi:protein ImuB
MGARRLGLAFHRVDGRVEHIRLGTARPSRDPRHLAGLLTARLDTVDPGFGVEDMILAVFAAQQLPAEQVGLTTGSEVAAGGVAPLLDRIGARLGLDALSRIEPRQSHIPERASICVPVDGEGSGKSLVIPGRAKGASLESMNTSLWNMDSGFAAARRPGMTGNKAEENANKPPRPIRLFAPPEPIEALWLLPDDPPFRFTWRRRPHRVRRAEGPERIAEEWWTTETGSGLAGTLRDYYRVEDEAGRRFWLVRAGLPGDPPPRWFVHGLFA